MKRILPAFVALFLFSLSGWGQGELDTQKKIFYRNEKSFGVLLNSNGLGFSYRDGKWKNDRDRKLFELEFNYVRHPKEIKFPYINYYNTGSYVYGKTNIMFSLRGGPGFQHEMFQKVDKGGISIRQFYSFGPALAIYKPIYYDIYVFSGQEIVGKESKKFDSNLQHAEIIGRSSFFKGITETKFMPGLYAKGGISFEYSKLDKILHALELGMALEVYPKRIPIMYIDKNPFAFFSFFVSYRFGKILNPQKPNDDTPLSF
jgi:hypothetical protein